MIRLQDWMTAGNPLIDRWPEIMKWYPPDKTGISYGQECSWKSVGLGDNASVEGVISDFHGQLTVHGYGQCSKGSLTFVVGERIR